MSIGAMVRRVAGPAFPLLGGAYRRVFVDINKVAAAFPELRQDACLLDVGGGDGAILNHLLDRQPTLRVVAVDLAEGIGSMIRPDLVGRVELHPGTPVALVAQATPGRFDAAFMSDVLHHVPPPERESLLADVVAAFGDLPVVLVVKEIIPQGFRSRLAFWADRNISGDRGVRAIGPVELVDLVRSVLPDARVEQTGLADVDYPNYCLVFRRG